MRIQFIVKVKIKSVFVGGKSVFVGGKSVFVGGKSVFVGGKKNIKTLKTLEKSSNL